jgi:hypothetical protein
VRRRRLAWTAVAQSTIGAGRRPRAIWTRPRRDASAPSAAVSRRARLQTRPNAIRLTNGTGEPRAHGPRGYHLAYDHETFGNDMN